MNYEEAAEKFIVDLWMKTNIRFHPIQRIVVKSMLACLIEFCFNLGQLYALKNIKDGMEKNENFYRKDI